MFKVEAEHYTCVLFPPPKTLKFLGFRLKFMCLLAHCSLLSVSTLFPKNAVRYWDCGPCDQQQERKYIQDLDKPGSPMGQGWDKLLMLQPC